MIHFKKYFIKNAKKIKNFSDFSSLGLKSFNQYLNFQNIKILSISEHLKALENLQKTILSHY
jgi:hypothetical protein